MVGKGLGTLDGKMITLDTNGINGLGVTGPNLNQKVEVKR